MWLLRRIHGHVIGRYVVRWHIIGRYVVRRYIVGRHVRWYITATTVAAIVTVAYNPGAAAAKCSRNPPRIVTRLRICPGRTNQHIREAVVDVLDIHNVVTIGENLTR